MGLESTYWIEWEERFGDHSASSEERADYRTERHDACHPLCIVRLERASPRLGRVRCSRFPEWEARNEVTDDADFQRVELESGEFNDRYGLLVDEETDPNYLRQLFSPTFIDWHVSHLDSDEWARELEGEYLAVRGPEDAEVDWDIVDHIAERVVSEAAEEMPAVYAPATRRARRSRRSSAKPLSPSALGRSDTGDRRLSELSPPQMA